jgi:putative transcriptional regulator
MTDIRVEIPDLDLDTISTTAVYPDYRYPVVMGRVRYEWDDAKSTSNQRKHGVDFLDAVAALEDPNRLEDIDANFEYGEERMRAIGRARGGVLLVIVTLRGIPVESYRPGRPRDMKKTDTTRVTVKPGDAQPRGGTDWPRLNAMTDDEVLAAALSDPDAQPLDSEQLAEMRRVSRVKALRRRLAMTQTEFARAFHLPITTLRDWEQRRSIPDAPARALLLAIERDPEIMRRLLAETVA